MPQPRRLLFPGALYHVFSRGNHREPLFKNDGDHRLWLDLMAQAAAEFGLRFHAYCLMTNHVHLAVETPQANLDRAMEWLKREYVKDFNRRYGLVGHLFESRYKSKLVQRDRYLLALVRYIHLNPVKAGMTASPSLYPWSSHRAYLAGSQDRLVEPDPVLKMLSSDPARARELYVEFMSQPIPQSEWRRLDSKRNGVLGDPQKVAATF